jgi:uncharacterized protein YjbI with pentapeptide repeats
MPKGLAAWPRSARWLVGGIAAVVLALVVTWALFVPAADWLAHHDVGSAAGSLHETALDNARGRLLTLGAGLFAAGALIFTAQNVILARRSTELSRRTFELTEQGQVTDRYTKAIEQLGSKELDVRIGGIYALERVARDSPRDHQTVMEVLTAFIREHSRELWPLLDAGNPDQERATRPDVQAAVTVVGRRDQLRDVPRWRVDLATSVLPRARLIGADLIDADLTRADLTKAVLSGARLSGALLVNANLAGAILNDADLAGARLTTASLAGATLIDAILTDAYLVQADLPRAEMPRAHLARARLAEANLTDANLAGADLTSARLTGSDLTGAVLSDANLSGARLAGASLAGADLTRAKLTDADLTNVDLHDSLWPGDTPVPAGWKRDNLTDRLEARVRYWPDGDNSPFQGPAEAT